MKHFKNLFLALFASLILFNCGNGKTESTPGENLFKDTVQEISIDTGNIKPVLSDDSGIPFETDGYKLPQSDTNIFYGVDYEEDTVIYKNGNKILNEGDLIANFDGIQKGDFVHMILKDSLGWYHNFFVLLEDGNKMDKYWKGYEPKPSQKLSIHWKRQRITVSDGGVKMIAYCIVKITEIG
jgi:hypothetical protein